MRGSGGFAVDAVLEINGEWQAWSGFVSFGLPIVNDLNGEQSEPEYRLVGGIAVGF